MTQIKPSVWKLLNTSLHEISRWFRYEVRQYLQPDGREAEYVITTVPDGVAIVAVTDNFEEAVLCREFRPGPNLILTEVCAGQVEPNEDPLAAATRELLEETGYAGQMIHMGTSWRDAKSTGRIHHYLCYAVEKVAEPVQQPCEFIEVVRMPWTEFFVHAKYGQMTSTETALRAIQEKYIFDHSPD